MLPVSVALGGIHTLTLLDASPLPFFSLHVFRMFSCGRQLDYLITLKSIDILIRGRNVVWVYKLQNEHLVRCLVTIPLKVKA